VAVRPLSGQVRRDTQKAPWDSPAVDPDEEGSMLGRTVLAIAVIVLLAWPADAPALAKDCPAQDFSHEAREEAVRKAPSCRESLDVMEACAYTATGDVSLGEIVRKKCEAGFLAKLGKAQRRTYDRAIKHCDDKYKNESGTMYRSFSAFCRAILARDTAAKFAKVPPRR
jgi:hypothetical protein